MAKLAKAISTARAASSEMTALRGGTASGTAGRARRLVAARGAAALVTALLARGATAAPAPDPNEVERRALASVSPEAAALVAEAEAEARAGHARQAWALYARAWDVAPGSVLPARGTCRLALSLPGRNPAQQSAAASACKTALVRGGTPEDMRNRVAATVLGPALPAMSELQAASFMADGAAHSAAGEPWGYAARADIALWLGDRELLDASLADLRRVAPEHEATRRLAALASAHASPWAWLGRFLVGATWLVTAAHAFIQVLRRARRRRLAVVLAAAALLATSLAPERAHAAGPPAPSAGDKGAPNDPLALSDHLMTQMARAEKATAAGDYEGAARAWETVTRAVPDRAYGFARLCDAFEAGGQRELALAACRTALLTQGTTAGDYTHLVKLLLDQGGPLSTSDRRQVGLAIAALENEPRAASIAERLRCDVAVHERDQAALADCTAKLAATAPDDWRTWAFTWELSAERGQVSAAERALGSARAAGAPRDVLARMERGTDVLRDRRAARALRWGVAGAAATLVIFGLGALGARARRRRQRGFDGGASVLGVGAGRGGAEA